jgi:hypothetical protein
MIRHFSFYLSSIFALIAYTSLLFYSARFEVAIKARLLFAQDFVFAGFFGNEELLSLSPIDLGCLFIFSSLLFWIKTRTFFLQVLTAIKFYIYVHGTSARELRTSPLLTPRLLRDPRPLHPASPALASTLSPPSPTPRSFPRLSPPPLAIRACALRC